MLLGLILIELVHRANKQERHRKDRPGSAEATTLPHKSRLPPQMGKHEEGETPFYPLASRVQTLERSIEVVARDAARRTSTTSRDVRAPFPPAQVLKPIA